MGITLYLNHHGNQFAYFGHQLPSIGLVPKLLFSMPVPQNEDVYVAMSVPLRKKMIILMVKKDGHNQVFWIKKNDSRLELGEFDTALARSLNQYFLTTAS